MKNNQLRVLIIEDDEDDYILTRDLLSDIDRKRFKVDWISNFDEAYNEVLKEKHDIYLLDYNLGTKTGIELIKRIHEHDEHVFPVIMLTGHGDQEVDLMAMRAGAFDYLVKGQVTPILLDRSIRYTMERFRMLKNYQASEERYRGLFTSIRDSILVVDDRRRVVNCNAAFTSLFGYTLEEIRLRKPSMVYKNYSDFKRIGETLENHSTKTFTFHNIFCVRKDGSQFPADITFYQLTDNHGSHQGFIGMVRDTTEAIKAKIREDELINERIARAKAEASRKQIKFLSDASAIFASSLDYRKTLANVAKLVVPQIADWCSVDIFDENGKLENIIIAHTNPKKLKWGILLRDHYPFNEKDTIGMYHVARTGKSELYSFIDLENLNTKIKKVTLNLMKKVGVCSSMTVPLSGRDQIFGTISFVSSDPRKIFTQEDLILAEELAKRAAIAIDNARLYERANEGIRIRDEFLNIASHELKTPLTSLQLQMQILLKFLPMEAGLLSPKLIQLISSSERQIKRLSDLINNLLDVSRISSKRLELSHEEVDLSQLIEDVMIRFNEQSEIYGTTIEFAQKERVTGKWDKSRIDQIVTNLLSNAVKYGEGKPVKVSVGKNADLAVLTVADQGIGIAENEQEKIFERFERTEDAKKFGGLGLGLFIVKQIVDAHGGEISVKSKPGKGSEFVILLPVDPNRAEEAISGHSSRNVRVSIAS